jgi:hypothetical protein
MASKLRHSNYAGSASFFCDGIRFKYPTWMIYVLHCPNSLSHAGIYSGVLMTGPHCRQFSVTLLLLAFTWTGYFSVFVPFMDFPHSFKIGLVLSSMNLIFLFATSLIEPGILPSE